MIFNGNGYTDEWIKEAERRGLCNLRSTPEALPAFISEKNKKLFVKHHIFTESELDSRYEIMLENYSKTLHIESLTLKDMVVSQFLPALGEYTDGLVASVTAKKALDPKLQAKADMKLIKLLSDSYDRIFELVEKLEEDTKKAEKTEDSLKQAAFYHDVIISDMNEVRAVADSVEGYIPGEYLPYPKYDEILFYI